MMRHRALSGIRGVWAGITVLALLAVGLVLAGAAAAQAPLPPNRFFGSVTLDGQPPPNGTVVAAFIGTAQCGTSAVQNGQYVLDVASAATTTGCGTDGATVTFTVRGLRAHPTSTFHTGAFTQLNLAAVTAVTWQLVAGAGQGTVSINAFLPSTLSVHVGDSVTWTIGSDEIHNVVFVPPGAAALADFIPGPEPGTLQVNPQIGLPTDPPGTVPDVDGTRLVGSGIIGKGARFTARFSKAGTYGYLCTLHPGMTGEVRVVTADQTVPDQATVDSRGRTELAPLETAARQAIAAAEAANPRRETRPDGTTLWILTTGVSIDPDPAAPGAVDILRFFPEDLAVQEGDTVRWVWGHPVPHTVTFHPAGEETPFIIPRPQPAGPPILLINPKAMAPAVPTGARYDGTGFVNSGLLVGVPLPSFELTFTRAGQFRYDCILHEELGQKGMVTVSARAAPATPAATPVALPRTGSGGLEALDGGTSWPWLAVSAVAGAALLALGGWRLRRIYRR